MEKLILNLGPVGGIVLLLTLSTLCVALARRILSRRGSQLANAFWTAQFLIIPTLGAMLISRILLDIEKNSTFFRTIETILGVEIIWLVGALAKAIFLGYSSKSAWQARVPKLIVDIVRLGFVFVAALLLAGGIWKANLTPLLTTFGVGSLVLGLALQDTLGNLFSGLALVFERPFAVGEWLAIDGLIGRVQQINWRAVRIVTKELNEVIVPNSVLTKEKIINFSRPSRPYGERLIIGFSYDHPPNDVRRMLIQCALNTDDVLTEPAPDVRVINYNAYSVDYEVLFFLKDYTDQPGIRNEFMTQVWYASRREGFRIPFPTHTVYKTDVPMNEPLEPKFDLADSISRTRIFSVLNNDEAQILSALSRVSHFANMEKVIREGDEGGSVFIILRGMVSISVRGEDRQEIKLGALSEGDIFGEMSFLTGAPRTATVTARGDVFLAEISKDKMLPIVRQRPELVEKFAEVVQERKEDTESKKELHAESAASYVVEADEALISRIKKFFGLGISN